MMRLSEKAASLLLTKKELRSFTLLASLYISSKTRIGLSTSGEQIESATVVSVRPAMAMIRMVIVRTPSGDAGKFPG